MNRPWFVKLGDVSTTVMGQAPPGASCNKEGVGTIFVKAGEFGQRHPVVREWTTKPLKMARKGDVLVCVVGATAGKINLSIDSAIGRSVAAVRPERQKLDSDYLYHFLLTKVDALRARARGLAQGVITREMLADLDLPLPPLGEQRRIAAILDKADALRQKRRRAIALLDSLTRSFFEEMFGSCEHWPEVPLAEAVAPDTIVTYGIVQAGEEFQGGVPYIRTGDIQNGRISLDGLRHTDPAIAARFQRSKVRAGEIVMSIRATVGTVALVPTELHGANLTQGTARISPGPRTDATYLLHYLRSDRVQNWIKQQVKGATFLEITLGRLRELIVELPPLAVQQQFATVISGIERTIQTAALSREAADSLFASLQHRAFSGQL